MPSAKTQLGLDYPEWPTLTRESYKLACSLTKKEEEEDGKLSSPR